MKTNLTRSRNTASGFTLMEILIVIAIIAILAAMTIAGIGVLEEKVKEKRTGVLIQGLDNALEAYQFDNNELPDGNGSIQSSNILYQTLYGDFDLNGVTDDGATVYYEKLDPNARGGNLNVSSENEYLITDAWLQPLYYQSPGNENPDFDIWSLGPDNEGGPNSQPSVSNNDVTNY